MAAAGESNSALVLVAARLLEGRDATTHWAYPRYLSKVGTRIPRARWSEDDNCITAAGVSAGIDMALHLAARLTDQDRAQRIQAGLEYDPRPPFGPMDGARRTWTPTGPASATPTPAGPTSRRCSKAARICWINSSCSSR